MGAPYIYIYDISRLRVNTQYPFLLTFERYEGITTEFVGDV